MLKPFKKIHGKFLGIGRTGNYLTVVEVKKQKDSIPILTLKHKRRCPICSSPNCVLNQVTLIYDGYMHEGKSFSYAVCQCLIKSKYFALQIEYFSSKIWEFKCSECGSKNYLLRNKHKLKLGDKNKMLIALRRHGEELPMINFYLIELYCQNCKAIGSISYEGDESKKYKILTYHELTPIEEELKRFKKGYNITNVE